MSVSTEINRIKDAVTAIVNAIKGKGVTVPTNAKIDDLATLIMSIPTGSGGSTDITTHTVDIGIRELLVLMNNSKEVSLEVAYTQFENGAITHNTIYVNSPTTAAITLENVVEGSPIYIGSNIPLYYEGDKDMFEELFNSRGVLCIAPFSHGSIDLCYDSEMDSGGASIDTCTVNVTFTTNVGNCLISATTFDGTNFSVFNSTAQSGTISIPNVVCGSAISINTTYMCGLYWSGSMQVHHSLYGGTITVPTTPNATYTVEVGILDD